MILTALRRGESLGIVSLSNSNLLPASIGPIEVTPVMLPPGLAKLSTRPSATGSVAITNDDGDRFGGIFEG